MRAAVLVLGLFAGLGHIALGQARKGAIFGSIFIICLNGLFLGWAVLMGTIATTIFWSSVGCTICVWGIAYRDLVLTTRAARARSLSSQKKDSLTLGLKRRLDDM